MFKRRRSSRPEDIPHLTERLLLSRAALFWENFWPNLWPTVAVLGLFVTFVLLDFFPSLPGWLHVAVLVGFFLTLVLAIARAVRRVRMPSLEAAERRLETDSDLPHRPLSALGDKLATGRGDPGAEALWRSHRLKLLSDARGMRVSWPRAGLLKVDRYALRGALFLLVVIALVSGGQEWSGRLAGAFSPKLISPTINVATRIDAWINPPAYTGLPPLFLKSVENFEGTAGPGEEEIASHVVPVGSEVLAQVQGGEAPPVLKVGSQNQDFSEVAGNTFKAIGTIDDGEFLTIEQSGEVIASWPIVVVVDEAPRIAFLQPPGQSERQSLRLQFNAEDDYGIESARASIIRADKPDAKPIELDLLLPGVGMRDVETTSYHDLTPHLWAGLAVDITLFARDAMGQEGQTETVRTVLPERIFQHPVARALIELRRELTLDPGARLAVIRGLSALQAQPDHFFNDFVVALAMRSAERRLIHDSRRRAVAEVQQLLWETALRIEHGDLAIAEQDLRDIQKRLMEALARGAPADEIERLMDELQSAMDRFLEALAEDLAEQLAQGQQPEAPPESAQMLDSQDLQDLLDAARNLARSGAHDAARDLLAQLQEMLENLRANPYQQALGEQGRRAMQMLRNMEDLMQQQQDLLDRSFRRSQRNQLGQQGESNRLGDRSGAAPNQQGRPLQSDNLSDAETQEALRRALGELMRELGDALNDIPRPLGNAEQAMREARDALRREAPGAAIDPQARSLDQLQQGMQAMVDRFMEQMGVQGGQQNAPTGSQAGFGRDPLGRESGQGTLESIEGVEIPNGADIKRAREILDELRRRRGEPHRPSLELDYFDRLLRQF